MIEPRKEIVNFLSITLVFQFLFFRYMYTLKWKFVVDVDLGENTEWHMTPCYTSFFLFFFLFCFIYIYQILLLMIFNLFRREFWKFQYQTFDKHTGEPVVSFNCQECKNKTIKHFCMWASSWQAAWVWTYLHTTLVENSIDNYGFAI